MKIVPNVNIDINMNKAISCVSHYTTGNIANDQMPRNENEIYKIIMKHDDEVTISSLRLSNPQKKKKKKLSNLDLL